VFDATVSDTANITDCGEPDDILTVKYMNFDPNPPIKGDNLTFEFQGFLKEEVGEGSIVELSVKYGAIKLLNKKYDLCELAPQIDKECPLQAGEITIQKTVQLPDDIPPGKYNVLAKIHTADDRPVACVNGVVVFKV